MNVQQATRVVELINAHVDELPKVSWQSGMHTVAVSLTGARVWSPRPDLARVYFDLDITGDKRHTPQDVYYDIDHGVSYRHGVFCNSSKKREACDRALNVIMGAVEEIVEEASACGALAEIINAVKGAI